jgi:DNA-binding transcriptional ArsR family regulator
MDEVFKALADASRRSLLDRLHAENGQTLNELCDGLAMTRQAVTKHLASTPSRSIRLASGGSKNSSAESFRRSAI